MTRLLMNGPHHTIAALDVLAILILIALPFPARWFVRRWKVAHAPAKSGPGMQPATAASEEIPEAWMVRTPIASARKEITGP